MSNLTVVEILEHCLSRAKEGEITGVAIATTHADLCTGSMWSMQEATLAEMLGAIELLKARMLTETMEAPDRG